MIFIKTDNNNKVVYRHYEPFNLKNGLDKTEEELLQEGYLVESLPEPNDVVGKQSKLYFTSSSGFWYEYVDRPLTLKEEMFQLKGNVDEIIILFGDALIGGAL